MKSVRRSRRIFLPQNIYAIYVWIWGEGDRKEKKRRERSNFPYLVRKSRERGGKKEEKRSNFPYLVRGDFFFFFFTRYKFYSNLI